jgi:hypothetical protein
VVMQEKGRGIETPTQTQQVTGWWSGGREKSGSVVVVVVGQLNMEHRESRRVKNTQRMW